MPAYKTASMPIPVSPGSDNLSHGSASPLMFSSDRSDEESPTTYCIVGAGIFGVSTALHLKQTKPNAEISLIDQYLPNPSAASSDLNKIIRADYGDILYMQLALEAQRAWETDPLYSPFFHQTGMLFAENVGKGARFLKNYEILGVETAAKLMTVKEANTAFPMLRANWNGVTKAYYNPSSGWGEADAALRAVFEAAISAGVVFIPGTVDRLELTPDCRSKQNSQNGLLNCQGVRLVNGEVVRANHILLCTGAATAKLLVDSAPDVPTFHAGNRLVAAAAPSCTIRINPKKRYLYENAPVFANLMSHTRGM
jgi:sarcosine oxidase/L-pipecolate oxidase